MKKNLLIIFLFLFKTLSAQNPPDKIKSDYSTARFNVTNYVGYAPEESKVTYYIGASAKLTQSIGMGLKGGIYNYSLGLSEGLNTAFAPLYNASLSNPGEYEARGVPFTIQNNTYTGALTGLYFLKSNLNFELSAGIKWYVQKTYLANITWAAPSSGGVIPVLEVYPNSQVYYDSQKDIIKAYYSAGVNYKIDNFNLGVFGDNVYSFGGSLGVSF